MSNAAVINATNASGQTAGTPISIETGGDVVLKAYGTGEGNWFVVMAFAPVADGVTGAPVTLTIDYNQPGRQTSAVGTSAKEWVGWVLDQGGTWEASGIVEGYQPGEALSDDIGTFASFGALPKYGVKFDARASTNGVQYTYGAGGWDVAGGGSVASAWDMESLLAVGDSITGGPIESTNISGNRWRVNYIGISMEAWMQALLGSRKFRSVHIRGRSGIRALDIATGIRPEWTLPKISGSSNAGNVLVKLGTNDIGNSSAITIGHIATICAHFNSEGRRVFVASIIPRRSADALWTAANQKIQSAVNSGIRNLCDKNGYGYIPLAEAFTDYAQSDWRSIVSPRINYDNIHPNMNGGYIGGKVLSIAFAGRQPSYSVGSATVYETITNDASESNVLPNPMLPTTTGYTIAAGAGGAIATNIVPSPDGIGNAIQIDYQGATSAATFNLIACALSAAVTLSVGDTVEASTWVKIEGHGGGGVPIGLLGLTIRVQVDGTNSFAQGFGRSYGSDDPMPEGFTARIFTPPLIAQSGDSINSQAFLFIPEVVVGAAFRVTIWRMRTEKNRGIYTNRYPWMVTNSDTPTGPQNTPLA